MKFNQTEVVIQLSKMEELELEEGSSRQLTVFNTQYAIGSRQNDHLSTSGGMTY